MSVTNKGKNLDIGFDDPDFADLIGATILEVGKPYGSNILWGDFAVRYLRVGDAEPRLLVMSFSDLGLTRFMIELCEA